MADDIIFIELPKRVFCVRKHVKRTYMISEYTFIYVSCVCNSFVYKIKLTARAANLKSANQLL